MYIFVVIKFVKCQGCLNLTYISSDYGIELTFDLDGKVLYNNTMSGKVLKCLNKSSKVNIYFQKLLKARNPPPICFDVPYLKEALSLCLKFRDLDVKNDSFSGCVDLIAEVANINIAKIKLGCFKTAVNRFYFSEIKYMEYEFGEFKKNKGK